MVRRPISTRRLVAMLVTGFCAVVLVGCRTVPQEPALVALQPIQLSTNCADAEAMSAKLDEYVASCLREESCCLVSSGAEGIGLHVGTWLSVMSQTRFNAKGRVAVWNCRAICAKRNDGRAPAVFLDESFAVERDGVTVPDEKKVPMEVVREIARTLGTKLLSALVQLDLVSKIETRLVQDVFEVRVA